MTNFTIHFLYPWLLLLMLPALAFSLLYYYRAHRKFRRTRNRVISVTLHVLVMAFAICVLAGMSFSYRIPNLDNEVIILVDATDSGAENEEARNNFIQDLIVEGDGKFSMGIVTFGYDAVYAAELTPNPDRIFERYLDSLSETPPDTTATDIAYALNYTAALFRHPETGKIVLLSDGIETDHRALSAIKSIAALGIKVDTVFFPAVQTEEVQLLSITVPDYSLTRGKDFELGLTLQSDIEGEAFLTLHDFCNEEDTVSEPQSIRLTGGVQELTFTHSFDTTGLHRLSFDITSAYDTEERNNSFYTYIDFELYNRLLIVQREEGASDNLVRVLEENIGSVVNGQQLGAYDITVVNVDSDALPRTLKELREYDQVVLNNISHADMPEADGELPAFEEILYRYVNDIGGGLFTISGSKFDEVSGGTVANAFTRADMFGTLYQELLPVQAINYTPPIGVVIIIDRSGSMADSTNVFNYDAGAYYTKLELAKRGALSCLGALSERDYVGIMSLEDSYSTDAEVLPRTMENRIVAAIENIEIGGGTVYSGAIMAAGRALKQLGNSVEKKHVFLVSDGEPGDTYEEYGRAIRDNFANGITFSAVAIGASTENALQLKTACETDGGGRFYDVSDTTKLIALMREELNVKEIKEVEQREFTPRINDHTPVVAGITQEEMPTLGGFYGTKLKEGASAPLVGDYVPIYAQWKHGEGQVGSFLCDLTGIDWSARFMSSAVGKQLLYNIIDGLFPTRDIDDRGIDLYLKEENYTTEVSVFLSEQPKEGQTVSVTLSSSPADGSAEEAQTITKAAGEDLGRLDFVTRKAGLYAITVSVADSDGSTVSFCTIYLAFSYSKEYVAFRDVEESRAFMAQLAEDGKGSAVAIDDPESVFGDFERTLDRTFDPTILLLVLIIVLFLGDIAVRKFQFKWLHEILRDRKLAKKLQPAKRK